MAMVEHDPARAKASGMTHQQLHDFAATPETGLPGHVKHMDQGAPAESRGPAYFRWMGHSTGGNETMFPSGHVGDTGLHHFAKSMDGPKDHLEDGGHWIQKATSAPGFRKGALTAKAHAAGESPMAFARAHYNSPGRLGKESRFAVNIRK